MSSSPTTVSDQPLSERRALLNGGWLDLSPASGGEQEVRLYDEKGHLLAVLGIGREKPAQGGRVPHVLANLSYGSYTRWAIGKSDLGGSFAEAIDRLEERLAQVDLSEFRPIG